MNNIILSGAKRCQPEIRSRAALLVLAAFLTLAFAGLGRWQYLRGMEKQSMLAAFASARSSGPSALAPALQEIGAFPVHVLGELTRLPGTRWLLLDNQRRGEHVGVRVYAALATSGQPLLVDFGWLPMGAGRTLPSLGAVPPGMKVQGFLQPLPGQGLRLAPNAWQGPRTEPALLTYLDLEEISADAGVVLGMRVLKLSPDLDGEPKTAIPFARDLDVLPNTLTPERHFGYALQWWGLAAATVVVTLILLARRLRSAG